MEFQKMLSVISGVLFVAGFIPYIKAILRGETKPAKASWIIWASLDYIVLAGMVAEKTVNGQIVGAVIGATIVIGLAMKYGTSGWDNSDKFCLAGAVFGISLWVIFKSPTFGIIISCIIAFIGSFPTFNSAWKDPSKEDKLAWTIFWLSCVCATFAIPRMNIADTAQPTTFFVIESIMMYILYFRKTNEKNVKEEEINFRRYMQVSTLPRVPSSISIINDESELREGMALVIGGLSLLGEKGYMCPIVTFFKGNEEKMWGWSLCIGSPEHKEIPYYFDTSKKTQRGTEIPNAMQYFVAGVDEKLLMENADRKSLEEVIVYVLPHISDEGPPPSR